MTSLINKISDIIVTFEGISLFLFMIAIPSINSAFICICGYGEQALAAMISSYLSVKDCYLPVFECPSVSSENYEPANDEIDENTLSRIRAEEFSTFVNNVIAQFGKCDNVILAGISEEQKSYLDFLNNLNVIEIADIKGVDFALGPFIDAPKQKVSCRQDQCLIGLFYALKTQMLLAIEEDADDVKISEFEKGGIVVIEDNGFVSSVIAINYAYFVGANILVVDGITDEEIDMTQSYIEQWQNGDNDKRNRIEEMIKIRINFIKFDSFEFATFFTDGLPYSLVLNNVIPTTYVRASLSPDFFIVNCLLYEHGDSHLGGAVIFSPQYFKDEETETVSAGLQNNNYFVKELVGKQASIYNIDMHIKYFPYELFHVCSHGGEIEGYTIEENFTDRDGIKHTVRYDNVLSFSPSPRRRLITVQQKMYFKEFDGNVWRSPEYKAKNYPPYVFSDMDNALKKSTAVEKKRIGDRKTIPNSCAIQCVDGAFQGLVTTIAAHSSPFIFNNTCWSWYRIAEPFLSGGARGYIGTLWAVDNTDAVTFATIFYRQMHTGPILHAFQNALKSIRNTPSEDIYIFWGLHFSTFIPPKSFVMSRINVFQALLTSIYRWKSKLYKTSRYTIGENIKDILHWINSVIIETFNKMDFMMLMKKIGR